MLPVCYLTPLSGVKSLCLLIATYCISLMASELSYTL